MYYLQFNMASAIKKKKKAYNGRNVRISDKSFDVIKDFVDERGLKLGRFVEDAAIEKIKSQSK